MKGRDLSAYALSKGLGVPAPRVNDLINEKRGLSPDTARRLAAYFGNSVEFWMGLQADYEIELERDKCSDEELHAMVNAPSE